LDLQAEREKSLDWGKKKASKQKKSQNIWNLLKDFISLHRHNISFGYPGKFPARGKALSILPILKRVAYAALFILYTLTQSS